VAEYCPRCQKVVVIHVSVDKGSKTTTCSQCNSFIVSGPVIQTGKPNKNNDDYGPSIIEKFLPLLFTIERTRKLRDG